jgi:hypothetical protein
MDAACYNEFGAKDFCYNYFIPMILIFCRSRFRITGNAPPSLFLSPLQEEGGIANDRYGTHCQQDKGNPLSTV